MRVKSKIKFGDMIQENEEKIVLGMLFDTKTKEITLIIDSKFNYFLDLPLKEFEVIDPKISRYWKFNKASKENYKEPQNKLLLQPKVFFKKEFGHDLIDGVLERISEYQNTIKNLNLEFPIDSINGHAVPLGKGFWVSTPDYEYSWETNQNDGMTICPETDQLFHNPYYIPQTTQIFSDEYVKNLINEQKANCTLK